MNLLLSLFSEIASVLLFQQLSTDEGVPYTPDERLNWLMIVAAVAVLAILVFVLLKVFRGLQRSRNSEVAKERTDSSKTPEE